MKRKVCFVEDIEAGRIWYDGYMNCPEGYRPLDILNKPPKMSLSYGFSKIDDFIKGNILLEECKISKLDRGRYDFQTADELYIDLNRCWGFIDTMPCRPNPYFKDIAEKIYAPRKVRIELENGANIEGIVWGLEMKLRDNSTSYIGVKNPQTFPFKPLGRQKKFFFAFNKNYLKDYEFLGF